MDDEYHVRQRNSSGRFKDREKIRNLLTRIAQSRATRPTNNTCFELHLIDPANASVRTVNERSLRMYICQICLVELKLSNNNDFEYFNLSVIDFEILTFV